VEDALEEARSVNELLARTCAALVRELGADACGLSRVIGDVLVQVAEEPGPLPTLQLGRGYLVSDYPLTRHVLERRLPIGVVLGSGEDAMEEQVLEELGLGSVLMLPMVVDDVAWALVEVYRRARRRFEAAEMEQGAALAARAAATFQRLGAGA